MAIEAIGEDSVTHKGWIRTIMGSMLLVNWPTLIDELDFDQAA